MTDRDDNLTELPSTRPYLLRAIWEWCMDCGLTPQILVNATAPGVQVPVAFVQNDTIILNVHDRAVRDLSIENDAISFSARFSGVAHSIYAPMESIVAIYARENGQGLFFEVPEDGDREAGAGDPPEESGDDGQPRPVRGKPDLKLV